MDRPLDSPIDFRYIPLLLRTVLKDCSENYDNGALEDLPLVQV